MPGTYESETAWNEGPPFGDFQNVFSSTEATGGGFSVLFDQPPWQKATIKDGNQRAVPDVTYNAAILHGVLTYLAIPGIRAAWYRFGGTSAGAPQWSAILAITNQKTGGRLGFLNSAIYQISRVKKAYPISLNDITAGTNSAGEFDSSGNPVIVFGFNAGIGWDPTTGTGSPIAPGLVDNLIKYVSPGDGVSAVATTKPKDHGKPITRDTWTRTRTNQFELHIGTALQGGPSFPRHRRCRTMSNEGVGDALNHRNYAPQSLYT